MTPDQNPEFRRYLDGKFERLDDQLDHVRETFAAELQTTRHGLKETLEQITRQVVAMQERQLTHAGALGAIEEWRKDEGPLDNRLRRHDSRIGTLERWKWTIGGAVALIGFLFPTTVGVILWALGKGA